MSPNGPPARCLLQAALGRVEPCPGVDCPFWSAAEDVCVLEEVQFEILCRPSLAEHLLELRRTLEEAAPVATR
jgi:hypothetical protein